MIITVDGPAAAGKSTVARSLAERLGFRYLDTGAMYRAATWRALQSPEVLSDPRRTAALIRSTRIELRPDGRVFCDGADVTDAIRTPEVTGSIWRLADEPGVREALVEQQRRFGERHDLVSEGRDQGTEVFPGADVKFYLDASLDERTRRRLADLRAAGGQETLAGMRRQVAQRDRRDGARPVGALRRTDDMTLIDSTDMTVDEVVQAMLDEVERRMPA